MNIDNLCMGCMNETFGEDKCPKCGYYANTPQISPYLPLKSQIGDRYIVGKMMNSNSEGATYIGYDTVFKNTVVIREFLPEKISSREIETTRLQVVEGREGDFNRYLAKFLDMWRKIARLRGLSALTPVVDIIEDNNTAYVITEHIESITLREFLLKSQTGYLNWNKAKVLFMPVLSTIVSIHDAGIIHGGINPDNLLIGRDGKLRLTGFSVQEARLEGTDFTPEFFDGYTPIEQYGYNYAFGTWSDIYAFSAVIYRALVGSVPQDAPSRAVNDQLLIPARYAEIIPIYVINALMNGLQIEPDRRTIDAETLREELSGTPGSVASSFSGASVPPKEPVAPPPPKPVPQPEQTSAGKIFLITFLVIVLIGLVGIGGYFAYDHFILNKEPEKKEEALETEEQFEVINFCYSSSRQDNMTYEEYINLPGQQKRYIFTQAKEYSKEVPAGYVIKQSIAPGEMVDYGTEIVLTVSQGPEYVTVPDISGYMEEYARESLTNAGLVPASGVIKVENDGTHPEGTVAKVEPGIGTSVEKGENVIIYVYDAKPKTIGSEVVDRLQEIQDVLVR